MKAEKLIRLAAKSIQHLPTQTRTDMALSLIGWYPAEAEIEKRKLSFLQKLCCLNPNLLSKKLFVFRLNLFIIRGFKDQLGFIPDIMCILTKYNLSTYLINYVRTSAFPSKPQWKNIINQAILNTHTNKWRERIDQDSDFNRFKNFHRSIAPSIFWKSASSHRESIWAISAIRTLTFKQFTKTITCSKCSTETNDIYKHILTECPSYNLYRNLMLTDLGETVSSNLALHLLSADSESFFMTLYDTNIHTSFGIKESDEYKLIVKIAEYIHKVSKDYNRQSRT